MLMSTPEEAAMSTPWIWAAQTAALCGGVLVARHAKKDTVLFPDLAEEGLAPCTTSNTWSSSLRLSASA
jgi:hypothetical protein